jgi:hypothetical protein
MMNSPFVVEQAQVLAKRPEIASAPDMPAKIKAVYRILFERAPAPDEVTFGQKFLRGIEEFRSADSSGAAAVRPAVASASTQKPSAGLSPWEEYVQTLLLTNEFLFVD